VDTRVCTSAGEIPDAVTMQGECEKPDLDPDGLVSYADEQQARRDQQQLLAAMRAKNDATASTTAAELPTNPPASVVSDALSPNTHPPHDGDGDVADVGGVVDHQTPETSTTPGSTVAQSARKCSRRPELQACQTQTRHATCA
jgi:hypothetical protein